MPRECMFLYLCMCRYGYVKNERKQSQNRQKRARDWKKVKSRSRGSKIIKESSTYHQKSSEIHQSYIFGPWIKFEELATSVPALSGNYIKGPLKEQSKKSQTWSLSNLRISKYTFGINIRYYTDLVPQISECATLVLK